jgi:hypothetical protein
MEDNTGKQEPVQAVSRNIWNLVINFRRAMCRLALFYFLLLVGELEPCRIIRSATV